MFLSDRLKQSLHALIPFGFVRLARVRTSRAKVAIGVANRKVLSELRVRTEAASADGMIGGFSRPSAVSIAPIAPDTSARTQNEYDHNHEAWPSPHSANLTMAQTRRCCKIPITLTDPNRGF